MPTRTSHLITLHLRTTIWNSAVPYYDICGCDAGKGKATINQDEIFMFQCEIDKADHHKHVGLHVHVLLFSYIKIKIIEVRFCLDSSHLDK